MSEEKVCGIYKITNTVNNKCYIGKSINIKQRFANHRSDLKKSVKSKDTNRYLYNSVQKYGLDVFSFDIIEELENDENLLKDRELYWMDYHNSCNRDFGYNLRRDSSTKTEVHEDTRKLISESNKGENNPNFGNYWTGEQKKYMSEIKKEGHKNGTLTVNKEALKRGRELTAKKYEENPQLKINMRKKISENHNLYQYLKIDKITGEILETFENRLEVLEKNPDYKTSPLLSTCNGWKSSYKGFIWRYRIRETGEIIEPICKYCKNN